MKYLMKSVCFLFVLTAFVPLSYAQSGNDEIPGNIQLLQADDFGGDHDHDQGLSDAEIRSIVEKSIGDQVFSGNAATVTTTVPGQDDSEVKKTFRYQKKKGAFDRSELPPRTFNNIPYPY